MITTIIGKTFLKAFNEKYSKNYTAKEFFEKEYFELFFNHNKYLMSGGNSPFENPKISWEQMQSGHLPYESVEERKDRYNKFIEKAENTNGKLDMGIAPGYPSAEEGSFGAYSGLVTDLILTEEYEDVYFSWLGAGLGIGVSGGYSILINNELICLELYEGWKAYRKLLNNDSLQKLKGNQINTWNGQWLRYKLSDDYNEDFDFSELTRNGFFEIENQLIKVDTTTWSNLFFSLSLLFPEKTLNTYVYSFGQQNKTIGFIPMYLKAGTLLKDIFKQLFHSDLPFRKKDLQSLFGMHIKRAGELGNIGLHALQPENIKKYMNEAKNLSFKKDEDILIYQSYKTWLTAMLSKNKETVTDYTAELAKMIQRYRANAKGNERKNLIEKDLLGAKTKKNFLDALTVMLKGIEKEEIETLKKLRDEVHLMTNEEFGYFNTLLKFDYAFVEKKS